MCGRGVAIESLAAAALWLGAWFVVLARWMNRRLEADRAAALLAATSSASLGLYSLIRYKLTAVLVLILIAWAILEFAVARYVLRVFADDRPRSDRSTPTGGRRTRP